MGPYRVPARATIAHMNANPSPLSSLTSSSGGVMPQGEEVASFATYPEAQRAVDALSDQGFPVQHLAIIGTDLRQVERITGRMSWGRAAMSGALNGLWIGVFFGIIMSVAGSSGPRLNFWACVLLGVLWGIVFQLFSYALTRGRRDFTSISQVVASRYSILAAREIHEASQALADVPGNLARGTGAPRSGAVRGRRPPGPPPSARAPTSSPASGCVCRSPAVTLLSGPPPPRPAPTPAPRPLPRTTTPSCAPRDRRVARSRGPRRRRRSPAMRPAPVTRAE